MGLELKQRSVDINFVLMIFFAVQPIAISLVLGQIDWRHALAGGLSAISSLLSGYFGIKQPSTYAAADAPAPTPPTDVPPKG